MSDGTLNTRVLHSWLHGLRNQDRVAREEFVRAISARLERLARMMLKGYPNLPRRFVDTDDILQGAVVRLMRSLEQLDPPPESVKGFLAFATSCIRGELLDLARHYNRQRRRGDLRAEPLQGDSSNREVPLPEDDPDDLDRWTAFHEAVAGLPPEEREVVGLKFYHGWSENEIADLMGISSRTVRRYWASAGSRLIEALGGKMPEV